MTEPSGICPICSSTLVLLDVGPLRASVACAGCGRAVSSRSLGSSFSTWEGRLPGSFPDFHVLPCPSCGSFRLRMSSDGYGKTLSCIRCGRGMGSASFAGCVDSWNGVV